MPSQREKILAVLAEGPATMQTIRERSDIQYPSLQTMMSKMRQAGSIQCDGVGTVDLWRLRAPKHPGDDDPSMIPGAPFAPSCTADADTDAEIARLCHDETGPTAEAVAQAIVAATRITGEDPLSIRTGLWMRARFPAAKALRAFYPDCDMVRIGRYLGVPKLTIGTMQTFENARWWPEIGEAAYQAAVEALERL